MNTLDATERHLAAAVRIRETATLARRVVTGRRAIVRGFGAGDRRHLVNRGKIPTVVFGPGPAPSSSPAPSPPGPGRRRSSP